MNRARSEGLKIYDSILLKVSNFYIYSWCREKTQSICNFPTISAFIRTGHEHFFFVLRVEHASEKICSKAAHYCSALNEEQRTFKKNEQNFKIEEGKVFIASNLVLKSLF